MEQWIERILGNSEKGIAGAVPEARVGIIQQNTIEVENKDIVIAMIQSVSMKSYPLEIFQSFGLVIADEVHLMATKIFSRAFFKTVSKYSLGLSATPYRPDKCEKVFTQHIGPVIHYEKRSSNSDLIVKCITYKITRFKPEYDKRGEVSYTKTLMKVCDNDARVDLIVSKTIELVKQRRKVLILGEYVNHLKKIDSFFKRQEYQDFTYGLLIGELDKKNRMAARDYDVIIATYKLASVGMDVKDLSALILASPRKYGPKLEQSVGRILRDNDPDMKPVIIDIIDKFYYFYYQGMGSSKKLGRVNFYTEYGYTIQYETLNDLGEKLSNTSHRDVKETKRITKCMIIDDSEQSTLEDSQPQLQNHGFIIRRKASSDTASTFKKSSPKIAVIKNKTQKQVRRRCLILQDD